MVGGSDPRVGNLVCASGYVTKALCGLEVRSLNAELCDRNGCTRGLIRAVKEGTTAARPGDSGGPVYARSGSGAVIKGSIVGVDGEGALLAENISGILAHLDARLATT